MKNSAKISICRLIRHYKDDFPNPIDAEVAVTVVPSDAIPADMMGPDIGRQLLKKICRSG